MGRQLALLKNSAKKKERLVNEDNTGNIYCNLILNAIM